MTNPRTEKLRGLLTAILTPFDARGELALQYFPTLLDFQRKAGVDGIVVCGTNGEGTSLSVAERKALLEVAVAHRGDLLIVAATGAANLPDTLDLTRHAAQAGVDGVLVLPPFFFKSPTAQGLANAFQPVLDAAEVPVLLYNIPQMSAVTITHELVDLLADHPNLAGIKDSTGDWSSTSGYIKQYPNLKIFAGSDKLAAQSWGGYGAGCISGGANGFPEIVAAVRDAHRAEPGGAGVEAAQQRLDTLIGITTRYPLIGVSKSILAHRGLSRLAVRPPLIDLTPEQEQTLLADLQGAGYL